MAAKFEFNITGLDTLAKRVADLRGASDVQREAARLVYQQVTRVITASVPLVPVRYGILRASHFVEIPEIIGDRVTCTGGYGGAARKYARAVHDNPRSGQTGGVSPRGKKYKRWATHGQWQFLSRPMAQWQGSDGPSIIANGIANFIVEKVIH